MKNRKGLLAGLFMLGVSVMGMMGVTATAEEYYGEEYYGEEYYEDADYEEYYEEEVVLDGDNSLYELGLNKDYKCSPDFVYNVLEYNVTVPAGTKKFEFDPVKSSGSAEITDITGTTLDANGKGTVEITVVAENGASVTYKLNVTSEKAKADTTKKKNKKKKAAVAEEENTADAAAEKKAAKETEKETEAKEKGKEAESTAKKDKLALEASESEKLLLESENASLSQKIAQLEQKEGQVSLLQGENDDLAYRLDLLMKVLYGLIVFAVLLLFFIINQSLRNKDLKDDVKKTRAELEVANAKASTVDLYTATSASVPVFTPAEDVPLSRKEQKRLAKEAKKNAKAEEKKAKKAPVAAPVPEVAPEEPVETSAPEKAPAEAPAPAPAEKPAEPQPVSNEPQLVKGSVNEPDVKVNMIDL